MRKRLKRLLESLDQQTPALLDQSIGEFSENTTAIRNYLTHYSSDLDASAASGVSLVKAFRRIYVLLTIVILKEAGFSEAEIQKVFATSYCTLAEEVRGKLECYW